MTAKATGTDVAVQDTATGLAALGADQLSAALMQAADEVSTEFTPFLYFHIDYGTFYYKDQGTPIDLDDDVQFAVNPVEIRKTLTCWVNNENKESISVPFTQELPDIATLDTHGVSEDCDSDPNCRDGWSEAWVVPVVDMSTGKQYDFNAGNTTMKRAVGEMMRAMGKQITQHDITKEAPVFSFEVRSYNSKFGKTIHYPVFTLEEWRDMEEPIVPVEKEEAEEETKQAKPARRRRRS